MKIETRLDLGQQAWIVANSVVTGPLYVHGIHFSVGGITYKMSDDSLRSSYELFASAALAQADIEASPENKWRENCPLETMIWSDPNYRKKSEI